MAISSILTDNAMNLNYVTGVDEKGNDIIKTQRFKGLKTTATAEEVMNLSKEFQKVLSYPVSTVEQEQTSQLYEEI